MSSLEDGCRSTSCLQGQNPNRKENNYPVSRRKDAVLAESSVSLILPGTARVTFECSLVRMYDEFRIRIYIRIQHTQGFKPGHILEVRLSAARYLQRDLSELTIAQLDHPRCRTTLFRNHFRQPYGYMLFKMSRRTT